VKPMVTAGSFSGMLLLVLVVVVCISAVVLDDVCKVRNAMRRRRGMVITNKTARRGNGRVGLFTVVILGCARISFSKSFASFDVDPPSALKDGKSHTNPENDPFGVDLLLRRNQLELATGNNPKL
jgi:hypothetical protein